MGKFLMPAARTVVLVFLGLLALPSSAQVAKERKDVLDFLVFATPELQVSSQPVSVDDFRSSASKAESETAAPLLEDWDRFLTESGGRWTMVLDRVTGRPALIEGEGLPWIPGSGNALTFAQLGLAAPSSSENAVPLEFMERKALDLVEHFPRLFGVSRNDLRLLPSASGPVLDYLYFLDFQWSYHGIPVEGAHVVFRVNNGNLVQFGQERICGSIERLDPRPAISTETAWQVLWGYLGGAQPQDQILEPGRLLVVPVSTPSALKGEVIAPGAGAAYRLVYVLAFRRPGVMGTWEARVDAHSGELLSFSDRNWYGHIQGGVYKTDKNPTQTEVSMPFPYADYGTGLYADAAGNFTGTSGTSTLAGKYVKIADNCGAISKASDTSGLIDFGGSTGTDCTTPGSGGLGNTHASRTQYWNVTQIKMKALTYLPSNAWLQGQLTDNVNINQTCNAYWNGTSLNFFRSGGGCGNTGELPGVSLHEWGHGLDSNDGNGSSPDYGTGEAYADTGAMLQTHQSCLGGGFFVTLNPGCGLEPGGSGYNCSGYGNCCTSCSGIRDVDYAKHASATPAALAFANACPTSANYKGPCGREGHCESYVATEANWDLATRDLVTWGLDITTAWQLLDKFWYASRPTATAAFVCTVNSSCNAGNLFNVYRVVDDCDGDLTNGTPHASAIWAAFSRHEIGCSTAVNTDNNCGCAVLAAPVLSGTAGNNSNSLSWSAVSGATSYDVYRNETACDAGFTKIGNTTALTFTDNLAVNGVTYFYRLQANGAAGCPQSPMSNCVTLTPTPCTTPGTPTIGTVSVPGDNQLSVSWTAGSPAGATYRIYRSVGACPGGTYSLIASGVTASPYLDTTVSGGVTYSYKVSAVDSTGGCESLPSGCASATATGACTAPPDFAGLASVTNPGNATCTLNLSWAAATTYCGAATYNVYRSTTSGFTPGPTNLVYSGVVSTTLTDLNVASGTTYYYVVRAKDSANGAEDSNLVQRSGTPYGPTFATTLLSENFDSWAAGSYGTGWAEGFFAGDAADWRGAMACTGQSSPNVLRCGGTTCTGNYGNSKHAYARTPLITVPPGSNTARLSFYHRWRWESGYDGGYLRVSLDGTTYTYVPSSALIGGPLYDATLGAWTGAQTAVVQTVVDLDAALNAATGGTGGAAGRSFYIAFVEYTDSTLSDDGWFIDDVTVTANVPGACTGPTAAPKPVPDGQWVAGTPMTAAKTVGDGSSVNLTWDVATCVSPNYNLYYGKGSDLATYTLTGSACSLGNTGSASWASVPAVPAGETFLWWVIVGTDGVQTESTWGKDSAGTERHPAASAQCGFTAKSTATTCP